MRPVHLCMVELKGNSQCPFPPMSFVFAPNQKRIIEHTAIHAYRPSISYCARADVPMAMLSVKS